MSDEPPAQPWTIRPYQPGDEQPLTALFARVFGRPLDVGHWSWKLKGRPAPSENVWLAVVDGRPIFQYAAIPARYQLPGGEADAMISVDTMTDPDWRRRGLLSQVGQRCYDAWRDAGVSFVIGLPNQQWGSRAQALGWQPLFPLRWLIRPLRPAALLARRLRLPALARLTPLDALAALPWRRSADSAITVRRCAAAGPEFDQLWQRCRHDTPAALVRDSAWVAWRFLAAPDAGYRVLLAERNGAPAGYLAYRLEATTGATWGFVADMLAPRADQAARDALLAAALAEMRAAGAVAATALATPGTWLWTALRRAGFVWGRKGAFSVQLAPLAASLPLDVLRDPGSWHLAGGDFDVI